MMLLKGIAQAGDALNESELQELNIERMLVGFLRSLLEEQKAEIELEAGIETVPITHPEFSGGGHS